MRAYIIENNNTIELHKYVEYNKQNTRSRHCSRFGRPYVCNKTYPPVNCKIDGVCEKDSTGIDDGKTYYTLDTDANCISIIAEEINIEVSRINFKFTLKNSKKSLNNLIKSINNYKDVVCLKGHKGEYTILDKITGEYIIVSYLEECNNIYVGF